MNDQKRVQAGVPTGGQFAASEKAEAGISLTAPAHVPEDKRPFIICPTCEGHGHHGPGHVYTQAERDEYDPAEFDEMMAEYRAGVHDVPCEECHGKRVVKAECDCADCEQERREIAEDQAAAAAERRFGC